MREGRPQRGQQSRLLELERYVHNNGRIPMSIAPGAEKPISPYAVRFSQAIGMCANNQMLELQSQPALEGSQPLFRDKICETILAREYEDAKVMIKQQRVKLEEAKSMIEKQRKTSELLTS
ncbi:CACTA en-spm transposon protein [Cucumis melo var. makuwa]|uniref:CACTA en-spm transposon protein n=1 Tax=Cucumis melo var. makuwa TaxID=1194695 RepID=A0A5D3C2Z1_CUCMM|nr:CACTA en-spm transposon protein [Cucumis melo var. makuwa]TYK05572.1 CACTA en-spm transposon protein [Cucumis melo var. makuwa]